MTLLGLEKWVPSHDTQFTKSATFYESFGPAMKVRGPYLVLVVTLKRSYPAITTELASHSF